MRSTGYSILPWAFIAPLSATEFTFRFSLLTAEPHWVNPEGEETVAPSLALDPTE
jgi:hypothetical protein